MSNQTTSAPRTRDYSFDNIKAILIFLVVLGHVLVSCKHHELARTTYKLIYLFHMPLFVFISGFFSKKAAKGFGYSIYSALVPFVIFTLIFKIVECIVTPAKLATFPGYLTVVPFSYWYLLCLFYWRLITPILAKLRGFALPAVIVIGLLGGLIGSDVPMAAARACTFLPFYWLGFMFTSDAVETIRKCRKWICAVALAAIFAGGVYLFSTVNLNYAAIFQMSADYTACGFTLPGGILMRLVQYLVAFAICVCVINLMPNRRCILTTVGQATMSIYIAHGYIVLYLLRMVGVLDGVFAALGSVPCLILCILISLAITAFFSLPFCSRFFSMLTDWLSNILKKTLAPKPEEKKAADSTTGA